MAKRSAKKNRTGSRPEKTAMKKCRHCGDGTQTFRYLYNLYLFDIDRAREIVLDGREAVELEPDDVRFSVDVSRIYEEHLDHVDTQYPGIIAHYWYPMPNGTIESGHLLIDGHHRAARCLRDGIPFFVHLLTEEESEEVTIKAPNIEEILADLERKQASELEAASSS